MVGESKWYEQSTICSRIFRIYRISFYYKDKKECRTQICVYGLIMVMSIWFAVLFLLMLWAQSGNNDIHGFSLYAIMLVAAVMSFLVCWKCKSSISANKGYLDNGNRLYNFWKYLEKNEMSSYSDISYLFEASSGKNLFKTDSLSFLLQSVVAPGAVTAVTNIMTAETSLNTVARVFLSLIVYGVVVIIGFQVGFPYIDEEAFDYSDAIMTFHDDLLFIQTYLRAGKTSEDVKYFFQKQFPNVVIKELPAIMVDASIQFKILNNLDVSTNI